MSQDDWDQKQYSALALEHADLLREKMRLESAIDAADRMQLAADRLLALVITRIDDVNTLLVVRGYEDAVKKYVSEKGER